MSFDFDELRTKVEDATRNAFKEIVEKHKEEDIYAFALYSDEGAMTVCPSSNTQLYLNSIKYNDDLAYYKFTPFEWKYEMQGADKEFDAISKILWDFHEEEDDDMTDEEFDDFRMRLYNICIEVLAKLKNEGFFKKVLGKDVFLTFEASEYEFESDKLKETITALNDNEYKEEYFNWMKTWGQ